MQHYDYEEDGWFSSKEDSFLKDKDPFLSDDIVSERSDDQARDDVIVVSIWLVMLTYALVSNILIVFGILKSTTMRTATSYWFIISLAVCDIIMCIISLVHLVPATAFHDDFVEYMSTRNIIMIFVYDLFWYSAVLQLGLMAGNRFVSIVYPMEYKWMFSQNRSIVILIVMYALGFLSSLPTLFPCCHTLWNSDYYITVYDPMDTWYKYVDMAVNSLSLLMMVFSYAIIIYKVRESGKAMAKYQLTIRTRLLFQQQAAQMNGSSQGCTRAASLRPPRSQVSKKEMRLFIQFFVVSVVFLITWTTWQWLPYIYHSKWAYFVMTSLFFINNSVNPTVYLLFNTQLRRELHYLLCRKHAIAAAQNRRKRTLLNSHANPIHNGEVTELQNGAFPSSTLSNANEVSQSSNSSSTEYTFLKDPKKFLIHNGGAISKNPKKSKIKAQDGTKTINNNSETSANPDSPHFSSPNHVVLSRKNSSGSSQGFSVL